jgi:hypothetical protein
MKGWLESRFCACRVQPSHGFNEGQAPHKEVWRLVRVAKSRWKIEQDYQQLKQELGLDHYEGRSWTGWHHHVTLVMLAHPFLTLENLRSKKTSGWTLPQTCREIQRLLFTWTGYCAYCGSRIRKSNRAP